MNKALFWHKNEFYYLIMFTWNLDHTRDVTLNYGKPPGSCGARPSKNRKGWSGRGGSVHCGILVILLIA